MIKMHYNTSTMNDYFVKCNPHPKGLLVGDCVKRALTFATGKEYREVALELNRLKKETNTKHFNSDKNWKEYVARQGWEKLSFPAVKGKPRMTVRDFCDTYPEGKYVLRVAKHVVTVENGQFYDTWDCSHKMVYNAWVVEAPKGTTTKDLKQTQRRVRIG